MATIIVKRWVFWYNYTVEEMIAPSEKKVIAKEAILNASSNIFFLMCLWLMTMVVPIVINDNFESAGIFTLALSIGAVATAIATYNIGSFFASDIKKEFDDCHYFYFGATSTFISLIICVVLCLIYRYPSEVFLSIIFYNVFKAFDNYSYITRIIFHRHNRLSSFSILLFIRGLLSFAIFILVVLLTKSLLFSMLALAIFGLLFFIVELVILKIKCGNYYSLNKNVYKKSLLIFYKALPVCIYGVCIAIMLAIPRLLFENITQDTSLLGYFGTMSSITALIPSFTGALLLPFIPRIAKAYYDGNKKHLLKHTGVLVTIISSLMIVAFVMVLLLGDWALELIYGKSILDYSDIFKWLVLSAGIQSLVCIFSDILVSERKMKFLLVGNLLGLAVLVGVVTHLIKSFGLYGVVYTYWIGYGVSLLFLIVAFIYILVKILPVKDSE